MPIYNFYKNGDLEKPRNISDVNYNSASYGTVYTYEPFDRPVSLYIFSSSADFQSDSYKQIRSLKNIINRYSGYDTVYNFDSLLNKPLCLLTVNSYHLGSGIQKGTVNLTIYRTGSIVTQATDKNENGVLYDLNNNKVGFTLYNEGFVLLTNTSSFDANIYNFTYPTSSNSYTTTGSGSFSWVMFGANTPAEPNKFRSVPLFSFNNSVSPSISFTYANKYQLNHSNNITYLEYGQNIYDSTSSVSLTENKYLNIKKTNKSEYVSGSAEFDKQTFITRVGLYDNEKRLIAVGNLANPIRKTENREFTIKLKIDF